MGLAGGLRPRVWARLTERLERPERHMDLGQIPLPTFAASTVWPAGPWGWPMRQALALHPDDGQQPGYWSPNWVRSRDQGDLELLLVPKPWS